MRVGGSPARSRTNPTMELPSHQDLHRELLLSHKRGLFPGEKPELQRVLEQRRLELHREQEQGPPSDLEQELRKRQQRMLEYERQEVKRREEKDKVPEFVRVKENLRHIQALEQ